MERKSKRSYKRIFVNTVRLFANKLGTSITLTITPTDKNFEEDKALENSQDTARDSASDGTDDSQQEMHVCIYLVLLQK